MDKLQVIDFFCGAGGFSEGFIQMGLNQLKVALVEKNSQANSLQMY